MSSLISLDLGFLICIRIYFFLSLLVWIIRKDHFPEGILSLGGERNVLKGQGLNAT